MSPLNPSQSACHGHAIIIGGSMAGLCTARVLAQYFQRVTVLERDELPTTAAPRRGVPQSPHVHVLNLKGQQILEQLFPGLRYELEAAGASTIDLAADVFWIAPAGEGTCFESGLTITPCSRALLESCIRQRVMALPNVSILAGRKVTALLPNEEGTGICGVEIQTHGEDEKERSPLFADLIVDASGRHSKAGKWLQTLGYGQPEETVIDAHLGYATRIYEIPEDWHQEWKIFYLQNNPPHQPWGGVIAPIEGDRTSQDDGTKDKPLPSRWLISLVGGDHTAPLANEMDFLNFAQQLPHPIFAEAIQAARPLSPIFCFRDAANRRRHYDQLPRWPEHFVVLGDAVCTFNPVYGQGMSVAAMGAMTLDHCLTHHRTKHADSLRGMAQQFQKQLAQVTDTPWTLSTGEDYRYRTTEGGQPTWLTRLTHRYIDQVGLLATQQTEIRLTALEVFHLLRPPTVLFHPSILGKVLRQIGRQSLARFTHTPPNSAAAFSISETHE